MERLIVIIGPTAVGKTKISIDLAKILDTEIISGDSMLVYRKMNIGTAKPNFTERNGIVHHLIDILEPHQEFSVTLFQELASQCITEINRKNKIPILAGGTGLYVRALLEGYKFNTISGNQSFRSHLEMLAKKQGNQFVHDMLAQVDSTTANRLHPNDLRRIIRALEVHHLAGENISQEKTSEANDLVYNAVVIGLTMDRKLLYERINQRVDVMINQGLIKEVAELTKTGIPVNCQAMKGIGYKETVAYLHGEVDQQTAIDNIKQATRHFAKRQLTWYRKMPYIHWFDVGNIKDYNSLLETIYNTIAGKFCLK